MKKVIDIFKWIFARPIVVLSLLYVHWFIFIPITGAFWQGLVLLAIYFLIVRITKLLSSRKILSFLFLALLFPVALYSSVFIIMFVGNRISLSTFDNEFLLFVVGTIFLTAYPVSQFILL